MARGKRRKRKEGREKGSERQYWKGREMGKEIKLKYERLGKEIKLVATLYIPAATCSGSNSIMSSSSARFLILTESGGPGRDFLAGPRPPSFSVISPNTSASVFDLF